MNIVITRRYPVDIPDGINIYIFSLANEFIKNGHTVTIVCSVEPSLEKIKSLYSFPFYPKIHSLGLRFPSTNFDTLRNWTNKGKFLINELKPDMIIINGIVPVRFNGFSVGVSHDLEKNRLKPYLLQKTFKKIAYSKVNKIVTTTSELQLELAKELGKNKDEIKIIPTCFDVDNYYNIPFNERENSILHFGTISYKNPVTSILAFSQLLKTKNDIKLSLLTDKKYRELLRSSPLMP